MTIERLDFENIGEADLQQLLDNQVPEGFRLDYKSAVYGNADADKRELMKDVSSFANTQGGHLVIGMSESGGLPTGLNGVVCVDPDAEVRRMSQCLENGIEPQIREVRICFIRLNNANYCFVIRVPKSWYPPHRIVAHGKNSFHIRSSAGTNEPDVEGLRMLFALGGDISDRLKDFRDKRISHITTGQHAHSLLGSGRFILHIVPFAAISSSYQVNLAAIHGERQRLAPIRNSGFSTRFNFEGFINQRAAKENRGYTQVFRNGIIEAGISGLIRGGDEGRPRILPAYPLEGDFFPSFQNYMAVLQALAVPPPFAVLITLEGCQGVPYQPPREVWDDPTPPIESNLLSLPECIINAYGPNLEYHKAVRPAFDALWNGSGYIAAQSFNDEGLWVGMTR